jgi:hypothetical protein
MAYYTLKFPSYAAAQKAAKDLGFWDAEIDTLKVTSLGTRPDGTTYGWMIDEIGQDPIVKLATYDEEGNELTPAEHLEGYIVNVVGELPPGVDAFRIPYGSGGRTFTGQPAEAIP